MSAEPTGIGATEWKRKAVHIGSGLFALLLAWLPVWGAWLMAAAALALNLFLLPGLTAGADGVALQQLWRDDARPAIWDASALDHVPAAGPTAAPRIITPHPGEAARLLDCKTAEVQADRRGSLEKLVKEFGGTVVLKGSGSLVSAADGPGWLCTAGNPGINDALFHIPRHFLCPAYGTGQFIIVNLREIAPAGKLDAPA